MEPASILPAQVRAANRFRGDLGNCSGTRCAQVALQMRQNRISSDLGSTSIRDGYLPPHSRNGRIDSFQGLTNVLESGPFQVFARVDTPVDCFALR